MLKSISTTYPSVFFWKALQTLQLAIKAIRPTNVYIFIHEKHEIGSTIITCMVSEVLA